MNQGKKIKEICGYLKDVLNFRDFIEIKDDRFYISYAELESGELERNEIREQILEKWLPAPQEGSANNHADDGNGEIPDKQVELLLIPKTVCDIVPEYASPSNTNKNPGLEFKKVSLMYIKVKCDLKTFKLSCISGESVVWADPLIKDYYANPFLRLLNAWIDRVFKKQHADLPRFVLKAAPTVYNRESDWKQYISDIAGQFAKRTGRNFFTTRSLPDENGAEHLLCVDESDGDVVVMKDETVFATHNIVNLLSHIIVDADIDLPLLETMLTGCNKHKKSLCSFSTGTDIAGHIGQMKNEFPLADAQRNVVHSLSSTGKGDVLAVSGPPGTGKTTMLQSVVADLMVRMTMENMHSSKKATSPMIIAASANNKAITNIIDAFTDAHQAIPETDLHTRWLVYVDNDNVERFVPMAAYMPSGSVKRTVTDKYFVTDHNGGGNYGHLRTAYIRNSSDFYTRASKSLGAEYANVDDIMDALSSGMTRLREKLDTISRLVNKKKFRSSKLNEEINSVIQKYSYNESVRLMSKNMGDLPDEFRAYSQFIDRLLDLTVRYDLYWLAVHYNECVWIKKMESLRDKEKVAGVYGKFLFDEMRYVCPCIVSTFFRMPLLFEFRRKTKIRDYNYNIADLLIVDEAGQVSPEIGLPSFAFAERAIVVGDVMQIPPVYSVMENSVEAYWKRNVKSYRARSQYRLLSCCKSSIMAIAEKRCPFYRLTASGRKKDGLFLDEHRRCVDEIIDYSNRLIYGGELTPRRGSCKEKCVLKDLPPMAICVNNTKSEQIATSRCNRGEVDAIKRWIQANEAHILQAYNQDSEKKRNITQLINIITPFKAQSRLIHDDEYLRNFPSGTVHTFQGAESPIVIFSPVYGADDNPAFIKNNHELMNVAVSRAKDHFVIIGSRECLGRNKSSEACRLLYEKLEVIESPTKHS